MDLKKRLFRRPVTTLVWLAMLTVMAAFLCVSGALWYSSGNLANLLDSYHTAVALRTDQGATGMSVEGGAMWTMEDKSLYQEDVDFLESLDSVKAVRFHTLTGGYSPAFTPLLGLSRGIGFWGDAYSSANQPYDDMMVVGTVERILTIEDHGPMDLGDLGEQTHYAIYTEVKVEQQVLGHEDYPFNGDPGYDEYINATFYVGGEDVREFVREGQRYLLFGRYNPRAVGQVSVANPAIHPGLHIGTLAMLEDGQLMDYDYPLTKIGPVAAPLDGSLEEFLADPGNAEWAARMDTWDKAQHSLPILGTDSLESMYVFVKNEATMVAGRTFTQAEYDEGSKVCILSESLANKAGLQVGDTVPISQFLCDQEGNWELDGVPDGMLNNPAIGELRTGTEFVTEGEMFTIVGIYRLSSEWTDTSYSITPNTVFIPKKAQIPGGFGGVTQEITREVTFPDGSIANVAHTVQRGAHGVYLSVELRNGCMEEFLLDISDTELAGQFHTFDQGYEQAQASINAVAESAEKLLMAAVSGWLLLLALYTLLYQGVQRRNVGIMRSLGAAPPQAGGYLFASGVALAAAGVAIGTGVSGVILNRVQRELFTLTLTQGEMSGHSGGVALSQEALTDMLAQSQLSVPALLLLAAGQLGIIALALWLHAGHMAKKPPRKLLGV